MEELTLDEVDITDDVKTKVREVCAAFRRNGFKRKTNEMMYLLSLGMKELNIS